MSLDEKSCIPCQGGILPLSKDESAEFLQKIEGWSLSDVATHISRNFEFKNFKDALVFVNKVGEIAENENHHPDITLGWGYVGIIIQTHKINGLHENDFVLAAKINEIK